MNIQDELERLRLLHGGVLMPEHIVNAAKPKSSPLHGSFDWDNGEAAHKWRLEQARHLIRIFVTVLGNGDQSRESRMYVSLSTDRAGEGGYRAIADVLSDAEKRATLLRDAELDMLRFRQKYAGLVELADVFKSMSLAMKHLTKRSTQRQAISAIR